MKAIILCIFTPILCGCVGFLLGGTTGAVAGVAVGSAWNMAAQLIGDD